MYIVLSNSVGRNDNFLAKARKFSILPTSLDSFEIRQHFMRILYIYKAKQTLKKLNFEKYYEFKTSITRINYIEFPADSKR